MERPKVAKVTEVVIIMGEVMVCVDEGGHVGKSRLVSGV